MNLNELGSTPLNDNVDMANLPEQMGTRTAQPPSGTYRFRLPKLTPDAFTKIQTKEQGDRVSVNFGDDAPLTIVQAPEFAKDAFLNAPYHTRINNATRKRGKGDDAPKVSDWDYLNAALGETSRPKSNTEFAQRLIAKSQTVPPPEFTADVEGSYFCNDQRDARFADGQGGFTTVPDPNLPPDPATGQPQNMKGCGMRYYEGDANALPQGNRKSGTIGKVEGAYPDTVECLKCQADMRRFTNLTRFKA